MTQNEKRLLYFLGLIPPSPLLEDLWRLKRVFAENFQTVAALRSPPHITLHMPFRWKQVAEQELLRALHHFASTWRYGLVPIRLSGFGAFKPRVIFVNVERSRQLIQLRSDIKAFCKNELKLEQSEDDSPYHPHVTLAFRDLGKAQFVKAWQEYKLKEYREEFDATAFALLRHDGQHWDIAAQIRLPL